MIVVSVKEEGSSIVSLSIKGHGKMGYGKDIVCAGVSSCFVGALNALRDIEKFSVRIKEGDSYVKALAFPDEHDRTVLETLVIQLRTIQSSYPDTVEVVVSRKEG